MIPRDIKPSKSHLFRTTPLSETWTRTSWCSSIRKSSNCCHHQFRFTGRARLRACMSASPMKKLGTKKWRKNGWSRRMSNRNQSSCARIHRSVFASVSTARTLPKRSNHNLHPWLSTSEKVSPSPTATPSSPTPPQTWNPKIKSPS